MKPRRKLKLLWLSVILLAAQSIASQVTNETAEQFVDRYLTTSKTDWLGTAKLMHPEALVRFKVLFSPLFEVKPATIGNQIFGVKSASAYDLLSTEAVYTKFLDHFYRTSPGLSETMANSELRVIGAVPENDLVHVLYRMKIHVDEVKIEKMDVVTVKKNGPGWAAMLSGDFEGFVEAIVRKPATPPPPPPPKRRRT